MLPITVPQGVVVNIEGSRVAVTGPKGELSRSLSPDMSITLNDSSLTVSRPSDNREHRSLHGLTRSLLANMVTGVSSGFEKNLEIVGVGYRVEKVGDNLVFRMGFSHTVEMYTPPTGILAQGFESMAVTGRETATSRISFFATVG